MPRPSRCRGSAISSTASRIGWRGRRRRWRRPRRPWTKPRLAGGAQAFARPSPAASRALPWRRGNWSRPGARWRRSTTTAHWKSACRFRTPISAFSNRRWTPARSRRRSSTSATTRPGAGSTAWWAPWRRGRAASTAWCGSRRMRRRPTWAAPSACASCCRPLPARWRCRCRRSTGSVACSSSRTACCAASTCGASARRPPRTARSSCFFAPTPLPRAPRCSRRSSPTP